MIVMVGCQSLAEKITKSQYGILDIDNIPIWDIMIMRVLNIEKVNQFLIKHPNATSPLESWLAEVNDAAWKKPSDVKLRYPSASLIHGNRVVFNIKGNKYRLIVKINYDYGIIEIRFMDTHAEYDRVNAETV